MSLFSFVDASGRVLEKKYSGPDEYLSVNTPSGCIAIRADLNPRRQKVVWVDDGVGGEATHVVVDIRPSRPDYAADGLQWQWSDEADDWIGMPTRAALMQQLRTERDAALAASDVRALRALEALLPDELRAYRQALRDAPQVAEAAVDVSPLAVALPTLDGLRARRWAALREQRNALEVSPLLVDGMLFDVDGRAVARIGLALKEAELAPEWSEPWTLADDSISTITAPVLMRVLLALAARGRRLHRAGRALRQQLAEATTAADIEAVNWPEETTDADA